MAGRRAPSRRATVIVQTPQVADAQTQRALDVVSGAVQELQARELPPIMRGTGSPENAVSAPAGTLYVRLDAAANATLYVKESGTGNTGWIAK